MENIIENNIILADFLGLEKVKKTRSKITNQFTNPNNPDAIGEVKEVYKLSKTYFVETEKLKFHKDWNLLMRVVEKIENLVFFNDEFYNFHILGGCQVEIISSHLNEFGSYSESTKILTVYKAVLEFVNWYNENVKKS